VSLQRVGQPVSGTVIAPVYAYDRIVIPAGAHVRGRIVRIEGGSTWARARAYLGGNFSPTKHALLSFDTLVLADGRELPIKTVVTGGLPNVKRQLAGTATAVTDHGDAEPKAGLVARARTEIRRQTSATFASAKQTIGDAFAAVKQPDRWSHAKDDMIQRLPYHPQYLAKGLVYDASLAAPLSFGATEPIARAPQGTAPAPDSILTARLLTALDSSETARGTPIQAVITEPVFSANHRVVLPEGTILSGEVTFAAKARRFRRNGRLRFLFESVALPGEPSMPLQGALHAMDASDDDHVRVDDEGGATIENPKSRFIAPTLAFLALRASIEQDGHRFADPDGDGTIKTEGSGVESRGLGGFLGLGVVGAAVGQITRPIGIALAGYGVARTMYRNVLGKGREMTFPANTPIQVQLAPGPAVP
jgi:hypothetical protein